MYALAGSLTPDDTHRLALGTYREMLRAGITCVGEFDYVHHSEALIAAADEVGIRLTLLDACYLAGRLRRAAERRPGALQRRRRGALGASACRTIKGARVGAAIHSVRAVPARPDPHRRRVGRRASRCTSTCREQRAENEACLAAHGVTPGPAAGASTARSARARPPSTPPTSPTPTASCCARPRSACARPPSATSPTASAAPATNLSLGCDSHAIIDLFEEARAVELNLRLATERRGHFTAQALLRRRDQPREPRLARGRAARARRARGLHHRRPGLPAPGDRRARDHARIARLRRHRRRRPHRRDRRHGRADRQHRHARHQRPRAGDDPRRRAASSTTATSCGRGRARRLPGGRRRTSASTRRGGR